MSEPSKKSLDPAVLAAIITVIGGVLITVVSTYLNRQSSPTPPVSPTVIVVTATEAPTIVPTDTVPPGDPTSTPAPTDTPSPFPTPTATLIPVGADWSSGCISALWVPYPASIQNMVRDGCYLQPVGVFFAGNGRLSFLYEDRLSSAEVHGMFTLLPESGTVDLKVNLRELKTSNMWVGVFAEPALDSKGLLMTIPSGDVRKRPFVQWDMPGPVKVTTTTDFQQNPPIYNLTFEYNNVSVRAVVMKNSFATNSVPVPSTQKWLFIGYQGVNGSNRIDAEFFDLVISP